MPKVIPNDNSWIAFTPTVAAADLVPTTAEVAAAVNLTHLIVSLNASSQGNVVPSPAFDTLFETSIIGTSQATFTADLYRDSVALTDIGWTTLARGVRGFMLISRFGGSGTNHAPTAGDVVEVWPIAVVSRAMQNMSNNTIQMFTVTCSVPVEPNEDAEVAA